MGRRATLTAQQAAEVRRRWALYEQNRPEVLAREYGLHRDTLRYYARDMRKTVMQRVTR